MPSRSTSQTIPALEPRLRYVSGATIKKKWKKLPTSSQDTVREILLSTQARSKNGKRKNGADLAIEKYVQGIAERLVERLPRMPFPPSCDEQQFDFEVNLHRIKNAEEQVTNNVHSMSLLRAQIAKEEHMLKEDQEEMERLKSSLKSSQALRRQQERTMHPTARKLTASRPEHEFEALHNSTNPTPLANNRATNFEDDSNLQPLLKQLRSHLESMDHNTQSLKPILEAVDTTRQHVVIVSSELDTAK